MTLRAFPVVPFTRIDNELHDYPRKVDKNNGKLDNELQEFDRKVRHKQHLSPNKKGAADMRQSSNIERWRQVPLSANRFV